jgi:CRISPR-associated exonuclease Cas4
MTETDGYLRVNELKNALYCPRISYYTLCLNIDRETDLSKGGIREEQTTKHRMKRRKGALHAVHEGERHFDVALVSHSHKFVGRLDEMVETERGVYLIDYKDAERDYGYRAMQMLAYKVAAEEMGWTVLGCYIYAIPTQTYEEIAFKRAGLAQLEQLLQMLHAMIEGEACPPPAKQLGKCQVCQYARFCNDVF